MLTDPALADHVAAGTLKVYEPLKGVVVKLQRKLLLTPSAYDELYRDPWERRPGELGREVIERRRRKHALLARFINGEMFSPNQQIKVLQPKNQDLADLVEFRSGPPSPQSRLFAFVYQPGIWIGCALHFRDDLGDKSDPRWRAAGKASHAEWKKLFPSRNPHPAPHPCDTRQKLKALLDD